MRFIRSTQDLPLLLELLAASEAAKVMAFDFCIPQRLIRDPFQTTAATLASVSKGNRFIQSMGFAMKSLVWIVLVMEEFLPHLHRLLACPARKVIYCIASFH